MINLNAMTTDQLFYIIDKLSTLKPVLSQAGLDTLNQHLIEIDAELEWRRPVGEFRMLHGGLIGGRDYWTSEEWFDLEIVGFEYLGYDREKNDVS